MKPFAWKIALCSTVLCALVGAQGLSAQPADLAELGISNRDDNEPFILNIDVVNRVEYRYDTAVVGTVATNPNAVPAMPARNFIAVVAISDVVAVNGMPAKGVRVDQFNFIGLNTQPTPGQAIADVVRGVTVRSVLEILRPDGTPIGTIMAEGFGGGPAPPGAPPGQTISNAAIVGGTGAFLGARGQAGETLAGQVPGRNASVTEDPANRRAHGGGRRSFVLELIPPFGPKNRDH
jgi:hypothetical protein